VEHGEVDHGERRDEKVGQDAGDLYVKSRSRFFSYIILTQTKFVPM
jgi:hypothetical protein